VAVLLLAISIPDRVVKSDVKEPLRTTLNKLDLPGFALFAPAIIMFLLALEWGGNEFAWSSATVIGLFVGAAGMACVFAGWEYRRGDAAMIPLGMLRKRIIWSCCLTIFVQFGNM